jgi:hypothetical protein
MTQGLFQTFEDFEFRAAFTDRKNTRKIKSEIQSHFTFVVSRVFVCFVLFVNRLTD